MKVQRVGGSHIVVHLRVWCGHFLQIKERYVSWHECPSQSYTRGTRKLRNNASSKLPFQAGARFTEVRVAKLCFNTSTKSNLNEKIFQTRLKGILVSASSHSLDKFMIKNKLSHWDDWKREIAQKQSYFCWACKWVNYWTNGKKFVRMNKIKIWYGCVWWRWWSNITDFSLSHNEEFITINTNVKS